MNKKKSNYNEIECRYNFLKRRFVTLKRRSNKLKQPFSFWTEDNRLQATQDDKTPAYYNYDASGERNLKITGKFMDMVINGQTMNIPVFTNQTLYASPLITLTDKGFTKHYFTEGQRICSSIGFGELTDIKDTDTPITGTLVALQQDANKSVDTTYIMCWGLSTKIKTQDLYKVATGSWDTNGLQLPPSIIPPPAPNIPADVPFYYLTDHLGSSSYITNNIGSVTQTLAYLPFGEDWVNINNNTPYPPLTPYKFNGKEKDEETGFNYFGARLYYDLLSIWLSVDPMAHKYPHLSSYVYCANNPVVLIDPNGMEIDDIYVNTQTKQVSVIKTKDSFDRVIVDGVYTGNREKGVETTERQDVGYNVNTLAINYAPSADKSTVSDYSTAAIVDAMNESNNSSATITSTTRSPEKQASIMFDNISSQGVAAQKNLYASAGDAVIDCYPDKSKMLNKINELGAEKISKHCADPSKMNIIDIAPSSLKNPRGFATSIGNHSSVSKTFTPYNSKDPAIHIEIPQKR